MKSAKLVILITLVFALAAFVLQNQVPWKVRFLWFSGEIPAIILLFLIATVGFAAGIISALLVKRRSTKHNKK